MTSNLLEIDYNVVIHFERRVPIVRWDFDSMRAQARINASKAFTASGAVAVALRLSVQGPNLEDFSPIIIGEKIITADDVKSVCNGSPSDPKALTVSRYCAVFSPEIRQYLDKHHGQVWGQSETLQILGEDQCSLFFPHNYYIPNLTEGERHKCIEFLCYMDKIMHDSIKTWRSLSEKAMFYFRRQYGDSINKDLSKKILTLVSDGKSIVKKIN